MQRAARSLALVMALALGACTAASPAPDASATALPTTPGTSASPMPSVPAASETVTGAWTELADAPLARLEMAVAAHDGRIWLAGGLSLLGEAVSEVEVFDPSSGEWSSGPALPAGIHHAALVSDGERLLLIGGYLGASFTTPSDLVLTLANGADTWEEGPSLPDARASGRRRMGWRAGRLCRRRRPGWRERRRLRPGRRRVGADRGDAPRSRAPGGRLRRAGPDLAARRARRRPGGKPRRRRPRRGHLGHRTRATPHPSRRRRRLLRSRARRMPDRRRGSRQRLCARSSASGRTARSAPRRT